MCIRDSATGYQRALEEVKSLLDDASKKD
jgi:hypothetical protein